MAALHMIKKEKKDEGLSVDVPFLQWILAEKVLRHNTPLEIAMQAAGDHQQSQTGTRQLLISEFCDVFLRLNPTMQPDDRLALAVQCAGFERSKKKVYKF